MLHGLSRVPAYEGGSMFHFVVAVIALSSASIFLAHAVEAYFVGHGLRLPFTTTLKADWSLGDNHTKTPLLG